MSVYGSGGVEAPMGAAVEAPAAASMPASGGGASGLQIQRQGLPPKMLRFMEPMLFLCFFCCVSVAIASVLLFVVVDCSLLCCCPVLLLCCGCLKCLLLF